MPCVDIYPPMIHEGDLSPDAFGSEVDEVCEEIHAACKGWGTDEKRLVQALGSQNSEARCKVAVRYPQMFEKDLRKVMKSECGSGDFGTALQFMAVPPDVAECMMIKRACQGLGTNELVLFPIICGRSNAEMEILKKQYFATYTQDLGTLMASELGGNLQQLALNCLQASEEEFDPDYHTEDKAQEDAEKLYDMGQGRWGTDETGIFKFLVASPPEYLQILNPIYADKYGYTLVKTVEKELGGQLKEAALFMMGMKLKPYEEVAKLIKKACAGFGTNELLLTCCLIRYQMIMKEVMVAHVELYGKTVEERVESEVSGDYKRLLLEVLKAVNEG